MSLDSLDVAEHDDFRRKSGSHERCLRAIDAAQKAGLAIIVQTVVTKPRVRSQEFLDFVEYLNGRGVGVFITYAKPVGAWEGKFDMMIDQDDMDYVRELEKKHNVFTHLTPSYGLNLGCIAVKRMVSITKYGDVMPCPYIHVSLGNFFEEPLKDIIERGMKIKYFGQHVDTCLIAEDVEFIKKYIDGRTYGKPLPVPYGEVFFEEDFIRRIRPSAKERFARSEAAPAVRYVDLSEIVKQLKSSLGDPSQGLPEEVFLFVAGGHADGQRRSVDSRRRRPHALDLARRRLLPPGWHIPGGIIRYKETLASRIAAVAETELGTTVQLSPRAAGGQGADFARLAGPRAFHLVPLRMPLVGAAAGRLALPRRVASHRPMGVARKMPGQLHGRARHVSRFLRVTHSERGESWTRPRKNAAKSCDWSPSIMSEAFADRGFSPGEAPVHYGGRVFDADELRSGVEAVLDFWLTAGRFTAELESGLAEFFPLASAMLVNSGSSANLRGRQRLDFAVAGRPPHSPGRRDHHPRRRISYDRQSDPTDRRRAGLHRRRVGHVRSHARRDRRGHRPENPRRDDRPHHGNPV